MCIEQWAISTMCNANERITWFFGCSAMQNSARIIDWIKCIQCEWIENENCSLKYALATRVCSFRIVVFNSTFRLVLFFAPLFVHFIFILLIFFIQYCLIFRSYSLKFHAQIGFTFNRIAIATFLFVVYSQVYKHSKFISFYRFNSIRFGGPSCFFFRTHLIAIVCTMYTTYARAYTSRWNRKKSKINACIHEKHTCSGSKMIFNSKALYLSISSWMMCHIFFGCNFHKFFHQFDKVQPSNQDIIISIYLNKMKNA